jgi:excisionase family DNA binding protein
MSADHQVESPDHSLSIEEAAESMGVSPATIRRRIKTGELAAFKRTTPHGFEWRIGAGPESIGLITTADHVVESPDQPVVESADQTPAPETLELVHLVERLSRENQQLAGQLGFTQAKLQEAERTVALLMAPKDEPAPEPPAEPERVSWWRRLFGQ